MNNPKFDNLLERMKEIHDKKNHDYSNDSDPYSNFRFAAEYAQIPLYKVFLVLEGVKTARLHELLGKGKTANNESIDDTLLDKSTYSTIMSSCLMVEKEIQPLHSFLVNLDLPNVIHDYCGYTMREHKPNCPIK